MVWRPVSGSLRRTSNRCVSVLLLASASPARRRLLDQAGIPHRARVSGVDEQAITAPTPALLVQRLAEAKAQTVHQALDPLEDTGILAVLGCDSVLVLFAGFWLGLHAFFGFVRLSRRIDHAMRLTLMSSAEYDRLDHGSDVVDFRQP